ncbi:Glycosyltransferase [Heracleum sosnowskyi]|uniref:Glycosyltransferase n=1 Tax=Heracleum sosnowskyi TaxID=360622 RepID=A0AAD8J746_9APIA|nr:Glycosyltransferase [Heracleum sosnowskyi]
MDSKNGRMSILMLPYLAHGHISPFLELAKQLTKRSFNVYLCSTPINLSSIKNKVDEDDNIQLVELHLPSSPCLPPHCHSTNGLPPNLIPVLNETFEKVAPMFINILKDINPNLVIYDVLPSWPAEVALSLNIPAIHFSVQSAATSSLCLHVYKKAGEKFPFSEIFDSPIDRPPLSEQERKLLQSFVSLFERSCNFVLVKSVREVEGKYIDLLSDLVGKDVIPVGQLIHDPTGNEDDDVKNIMKWLDKKEKSSVVFVCFGSENYLSAEEVIEMANALEATKCNFIWALRSPRGDEKGGLLLPEGFVERIGDLGLILEWAPQKKILEHSSTGAFLSHCGWSSCNESIKFGVPIIAMPMTEGDQHTNAKLAVEIGVGMHVNTESGGKFKREEIVDVIRKVLVEDSGECLRKKARELSLKVNDRAEEDLDKAVNKLVQICSKMKKTSN